METIRKHKELFCALGAIIICAVLILVWREYDRTFLANTTDDLYDVAVRKMVYDDAFKRNKQMWTDSVINDFKPLREPFIAYQQGSLTYTYGRLAVIKAVSNLES